MVKLQFVVNNRCLKFAFRLILVSKQGVTPLAALPVCSRSKIVPTPYVTVITTYECRIFLAMKQLILLLPEATGFSDVQALAQQTFAHVHIATSLAECFDLLGNGFSDVIICSLKFSSTLRSDARCKNVPVITLCVEGDSLSDLFTLGLADEVLFLPVSQEEFLFRCLKAQQNSRRGGVMERRQRDRVTGFLNAPGLQAQTTSFEKLAARGGSVALYYFAITNLQAQSQEFGTSLADALLAAIAKRLESLAPKPGSTFIRLADSILVAIEPVNPNYDVEARTTFIKQAMNQPYEAAGAQLGAKIEIGAAVAPGDGATPEELLQIAFAKTWGNNRPAPVPSFLPQRIGPEALEEQAGRLIEALRTSLLSLDYQPVFDFETGAIAAAESLLHWPKGKIWQDCRQALIECNVSGLGFAGLTEAVIERASRDFAHFNRWAGPVCINIGVDTLRLAKLAMNLARFIQSGKIDPKRFVLVIQFPKGNWRKPHGFELLRDLGFAMAVDFAGNAKGARTIAASSGLAMAKFDREACASADAAPQIPHLRSLGLKVIASKLENAEDDARARSAGCSAGQG